MRSEISAAVLPLRHPLPMLLVVFALQLIATMMVVPPWQNPDEPQHVMFASVMAKYGPGILPHASDDQIEAGIVRSMVHYRWWTFYGRPMPEPVPPTFKGIENVEMATIHGPALFYITAGAVLNWLPSDDATLRLYAMRTLSALMGLATLACIWAGTTLLFGPFAGFVVASVTALHPQLAIVSTTAGPDGCANLAGALVWWQVGRLWAGRHVVGSLAVLWASALAAASAVRLGAPLLLVAGCVTVWVIFRHRRPISFTPLPLMIVGAAAAAAVALIASRPVMTAAVRRTVTYAMAPVRLAIEAPADLLSPWGWASGVAASFWMTAGWMRYPGPKPMMYALAAVGAVAAFGVVAGWRRDVATRGRIALVLVFLAVQVSAVVVAFYFNSIGAQGRYLYPVFAPILSLLWFGLNRVTPAAYQPMLGTLVVAGICGVNLTAWYAVLFPIFVNGV